MSTLSVSDRPAADTGSEMHVSRFVRPFRRYGRLFLTIAVVLAVLGVLAILVLPRSYTAEVRLIAGNPNRDATDVQSADGGTQQQTSLPILNALVIATGLQSTQTYAELIQETPVAQRVIDDLHLPVNAEALLAGIQVAPINDTPMLSLRATWHDPQSAAAIANDMAAAFVERERDLVAQQADAGISFIASQLPLAEAQVRQTNFAAASFMAAHHLTDATTQATQAATALDTLDQKIAQTQVDRRQAQAQLAAIQTEIGQTPTMIPGQAVTAPNPVVQQLHQQLADAQVQLSDDAQRMTDRHPVMVQLHRRIADLQQRIASSPATIQQSNMDESNAVAVQLRQQAAALAAQVQADVASEQAMVGQRRSMMPSIAQLPTTTATLSVLQRRAKLAQDAYYAMLQKYDELTVAKSTALSDLTVTQPASSQNAVPTPSLKLGLIAVALLSLGAAFAVVLVLDLFDSRIGDERDVEQLCDIPALGRIDDVAAPLANGDESKRRVRMEAAHDEVLDAMRFAGPTAPRTIAVLSPAQGDGKTTMAINLALCLAERQGPVLIVDADLRRPSIHKQLRVPESPGLGDVLERSWPIDQAIQHTSHSQIDVLTCGTPVRNPIVALQSGRLRSLLDSLSGRYAAIIVDTCALNPVHDALEVARSVDASLLVISAGHTRTKQVARTLDRLARAGVESLVGYVLNRAKTTNERLAYYTDRPSPVFATSIR
ncbi:MAG TPA: polysaccharide biosynthesis tyrosine autokinase [Candidatus Tyrphobacter sp.]